ncbi:MAG: hypothetical protein FNP40_08425 [Dehalobacter sp. 4CP]|uniref:hypothetical protein n=1 Tax=Dehalobacter sp. CP TaxID=2594474 RepID=UPI0013CA136A|nr:hypothetical protein [Dehalobacter sp. 4CP]
MSILYSVLLALGIAVSLRTRVKVMMWRSPEAPNRLAKAITQLVGTAGGIYISLELLLTFLGIPENIWNPSTVYFIKPLAVFSLIIAILQPYGQKIWETVRGRSV